MNLFFRKYNIRYMKLSFFHFYKETSKMFLKKCNIFFNISLSLSLVCRINYSISQIYVLFINFLCKKWHILIWYHSLYHYNSHTKYEHNINSNHKENSENVSEMSQTATVQIKSFIQTLHNIKHNKYIHLS